MRLGFYPNATRPVINLVFPSINLPAAGSRQGKPPQAKCYSSLLVFEVTASWAAEAAACGLWLVGLLKIWSLTFQVRMSHRHWSHNCSCEITQAHWEERTSEQTCGLESVSDNTTLCVCLCVCVCVCVLVHDVFPHLPTHAVIAATTCWNTIASSSTVLFFLLSSKPHPLLCEFIPFPALCRAKPVQSPSIVPVKNLSVCIQTKNIYILYIRHVFVSNKSATFFYFPTINR